MTGTGFNIDVALQRVIEEAYSLFAALPLLLIALLIVWLGWLLGRWLSRRSMFDGIANRSPFLRSSARTTVHWVVSGIAVLVALEITDATTLVGAVLGTAGLLGVALGFAFKETLENYLAGILMSLRQPFAPRDHVVINGNEGLVISMTSRATILMTPDGNHLRLPNALVFRSVMLNYTRNPSRRFEFDVGMGVNEDLVLAQHIGVRELGRLDGVMHKPPPRAYIAALGDSNVQLRFHGWVDQRTHDFLMVKSEGIRKVKLALEGQGMDMPEPIYRVQVIERASATTVVPSAGGQRASAPDEAVDTRSIRDIQEQIDQEPRPAMAQDLLNPTAPKE